MAYTLPRFWITLEDWPRNWGEGRPAPTHSTVFPSLLATHTRSWSSKSTTLWTTLQSPLISCLCLPVLSKTATLLLQYPSATNTCPLEDTATEVGLQKWLASSPGINFSPSTREGVVAPLLNIITW